MLAGCASAPPEPDHSSRYTITQDRAPSGHFDVSSLADAVPRYEQPCSAGNKSPYSVWGKTYSVMASNEGYVERGVASWYGEKFHGHKTSNGETFDMYTMSAAHKSLQIPGYARVTNLDNGRSVIVRVNDRGPFHGDRLIDLSYAAAKKLGYQGRGTARVEVAAITVRPDGSMMLAGKPFTPGTGATLPPWQTGVARLPETRRYLCSSVRSAALTRLRCCHTRCGARSPALPGSGPWTRHPGVITGYRLAPSGMPTKPSVPSVSSKPVATLRPCC